MKYKLIKDVISLIDSFEKNLNKETLYENNIEGFKQWIYDERDQQMETAPEPEWEGKENGRSPESVINTLIVHMNRYAKTYSKSALHDSDFSTQEDFIYLINLRAFGEMKKTELIRKNIQDKPTGMLVINRLIGQGWVEQKKSETDKRSKVISLTDNGNIALEKQMTKIRQATQIVTGNLTHSEKMDLIRILDKLDHFHKPIFYQNIDSPILLEKVFQDYLPSKN